MAISYIHPHVESTITDNSAVYVASSGTTKLFAVFTSEKGPDNIVKLITSVSEFLFYYGEPNMKLYGQCLYNVVNWLENRGGVYCLRVLPKDACFANAIVNIQAKRGTKKALNKNEQLVDFSDVTLRSTVLYSKVNAISKATLETNELTKRVESETVDGFANYPLFAVIPKGRGSGYKGLGFSIFLNRSYESTYDFRLYDFSVTQVAPNGANEVIQGPFVVSLDPDAISLTGESMFIENVLYKYCDYFDILFCEANYDKLAEVINPNVHPACLDMISGITRVINDEPETYFDEDLGLYLDTHFSLHKTSIHGEDLGILNIVEPNNEVNFTIVDVDNTTRQKIYLEQKKVVETMRDALSKIRKADSSYQNIINEFKKTDGNDRTKYIYDAEQALSALETRLNKITASTDLTANDLYTPEELAVDASLTNANYVNDAAEDAEDIIKDAITCYMNAYSWLRITGSTDDSVDFMVDMENAQGRSDIVDTISLQFASILTNMNKLRSDKESAELSDLVSDKILLIANTITDVSEALTKLEAINRDGYIFAESKLVTISEKLNGTDTEKGIIYYYDIIIDENTLPVDRDEAIATAFNKIENSTSSIFTDITNAVDLIVLEYQIDRLKIALNALYSSVPEEQRATKHIKDILYYVSGDPAETGDQGLFADPEYLKNIAEFSSIITNYKEAVLPNYLDKTYSVILHDYTTNIPLLNGSDGIIEGELPTSAIVEKLIANGYLGNIDNTITDKDMFPFDMVLDANYGLVVKQAIVRLTTQIRNDFVAILDTKCQGNAQQSIDYRKRYLNYTDFRLGIFTQDFILSDGLYTNQKIQVTPTYYLASKIPYNDNANGLHWNFVGPRRGVITGYDSISYLPNPEWKEQLYKAQVNYVEQDRISTRFGSQNTAQHTISALSNISNVRCLLKIQRDVEELMKNYIFEWNDNITISQAQGALNSYLSQWLTNRACTSISGSVYASDYDRKQKILRVRIELVFNAIIERIIINLNVNG